MIDTEKEYWFAFEPYIHITLKEKEGLLYNTLDGEFIRVTEPEILVFLKEIMAKENCGVIKVTRTTWEYKSIYNLLMESREKFFGDLYDCSLSDRKPIQFYPILNLQEDVKRIQKLSPDHIGTKMFTYLYQITIETGRLEREELCNFFEKIWEQVHRSHLKCLRVVVHSKTQISTLQTWIKAKGDVNFSWEWIMKPELGEECLSIIHDPVNIVVEFPCEVFPALNTETIKWWFKVQTLAELETVSFWIDKYNIQQYKIEPIYNGTNLSFFEEYVFLKEEEILSRPISMQTIMRNQVLNANDFGKIYITSEGNIYANRFMPAIGNLYSDTIRQLIHKEMLEGQSWLRIRDQKPCCDCVFQWLCPPLSDYELLVGKMNLCHLPQPGTGLSSTKFLLNTIN